MTIPRRPPLAPPPSSPAVTLAVLLLVQLCNMMIFVFCQVLSYCLSQIILSAALGGS